MFKMNNRDTNILMFKINNGDTNILTFKTKRAIKFNQLFLQFYLATTSEFCKQKCAKITTFLQL